MVKSPSGRKVFIAVDLGGSSGRVLAGVWSQGHLRLVDVHRFPTPSVLLRGKLHWDILCLYSEIKTGMRLAVQTYGDDIESVAVDTWAVDYGLIDSEGELLANPICYRDERTDGVMEQVTAELGREAIFAETGIQFLFFNTLYQLAAEVRDQRPAFRTAERLLFLPDLLNFWLSGVRATERSVASSSQMLNPQTGKWSQPILEKLGISEAFMGEIVESGVVLGTLSPEVAGSLDVGEAIKVVAAAGHDTASAFMALPESREDFAILSSGTWSVLGCERSRPYCDPEVLQAGFSNEIGFEGTVRLLKNICGMWLLEECRRQWKRDHEDLPIEDIVSRAEVAEPMRSLINPDDEMFAHPCDMPAQIRAYCEARGEPIPEGVGQIARCIFDSLAMKYAVVFRQLEAVVSGSFSGMYILGGGSRNAMLNQLTADAIGLPVICGTAEATALGNVMAQMVAAGEARDLADARERVALSFPPTEYQPTQNPALDAAKARFDRLLSPSDPQ